MTPHNKLIDSLPAADRAALFASGNQVDLSVGQSLQASRHSIARVYFPTSAYVSLQARTEPAGAEVMMVGHEGALGGQLVLGEGAQPLDMVVQGAGEALRVDGAAFGDQLAGSPALRAALHAYVDYMIQQIAISCGCVHGHVLLERLARRLLTTHDCARRADFHVTHEFLAAVMGVRRVGVTNAASLLQDQGLITYRRGEVSVVDRKGLEAASCGCYADSRRTYTRAMRGVRDP
ncbi:Crp/Fnr family transcriptional regulator [Ramlibacter sp. PS4R-6]|uniref:Crp/Fnr family transcriptional regulator n=1 Tax=Ramlibacter sp. PS4R-6 TaxID=3133438 RepID=UPI0030B434C2